MSHPQRPATTHGGAATAKRGVVAVIARRQSLLVIRRSKWVDAPRALCFPGGAIELGESEPDALQRELREELAVQATAHQRLWKSVTSWGVELSWWSACLDANARLLPDENEVESVHWLTIKQLRESPDLLESNREFLDALERDEFRVHELQR